MSFLPPDISITDWASIAPYAQKLQEAPVGTATDLQRWLQDYSDFSATVSEDFGWRYIRMNIDTNDADLQKAFGDFVEGIQPHLTQLENDLHQKLIDSPALESLGAEYQPYLRGVRTDIEIFREKNIPLQTELQKLEQEFGILSGNMMIEHEGQKMTLSQASKYLEDPDRALRKTIYEKMQARSAQDREALDDLMSQLVKRRHQMAINADEENYRDYRFKALGRFDYTPEDCQAFWKAVKQTVVPLVKKRLALRKEQMGLPNLQPYDTAVDPLARPALKPFSGADQLLERSKACLGKIDPLFSQVLQEMEQKGHLDLESKEGKTPGGFNYPLQKSGLPFVFMNAVGAQRDVETIVHEMGHAVHSYLGRQWDFTPLRSTPSEVAEVASMSMELFTMESWDAFYPDAEDLERAKTEKLEDLIFSLPAIAKGDEFQHWMYTHPEHTAPERREAWHRLCQEYETGEVDFSDYPEAQDYSWQRILHFFEVPFYYIEYGFAQLGSIALWKNYLTAPPRTLQQYRYFLSLGYTKNVPELYKAAGVRFDFSPEYIGELMEEVEKQLRGEGIKN